LKELTENYFFIFRNDKWDLPKGGVEKKELIIEAAKREVTEKKGVGNIIIK
jgi:ADP-ribose pyrophosphatase